MSNLPPPLPPTPEPAPRSVPTLPADLSFAVTPYRPEGGFSPLGLVLLFVGLSVAGILLGVLTYFVSKFIYLIFVFPLFIGLGLGAIGAFLVKAGKVRTPWLAGVAGLLAGILAMLTTHYLSYRAFAEEMDQNRAQIMETLKNIPNEQFMTPEEHQELLQVRRALAVKNFFDFVDLQAFEGVSINSARGGNGKGINLGYIGTYIYWGIEMLIVAGIVFAITRKPALEPFCSISNEWKTERCGDNFAIPLEVGVQSVAEALKDGSLGKVAGIKAHDDGTTNGVPARLYVYASPQHSDQIPLDVKLVQFVPAKNGKTEEKELAMVSYPGSAISAFETMCGVSKTA